MLVAEIIKLGLREGLEDLPSPEGPLLPGFPFKISSTCSPTCSLTCLSICWLTSQLRLVIEGLFNAFNVSICSRF